MNENRYISHTEKFKIMCINISLFPPIKCGMHVVTFFQRVQFGKGRICTVVVKQTPPQPTDL